MNIKVGINGQSYIVNAQQSFQSTHKPTNKPTQKVIKAGTLPNNIILYL